MAGAEIETLLYATINPMIGEQLLAGFGTDAPESISVFSRAQYKTCVANVKQKATPRQSCNCLFIKQL
jgi:hypothetical protein